MLGSLPARREARAWARQVGGAPASRAMADYQLAATELALAHLRRDRGIAAPRWFQTRQAALLELMAEERVKFLGIPPTPPSPPPWAQQGPSVFDPKGPPPGSYGPMPHP
jgi:hypothetical protein